MDYSRRKQAVLDAMNDGDADWLLVSHLPNIRYLSGYSGSYAMLLISQDKQYILTDGRYAEQVRNEVVGFDLVLQGKRKQHETVRDTIGDLSGATVWFEAEYLSHANTLLLQEHVPAKQYVPRARVIETLRECKEEAEIDAVRRALAISEGALGVALESLREGMTERELNHLLFEESWKAGAEKESFESLILFGERSSLPHGKPGNRALKKGDTVLMDFGCVVDGYCSDITRTVFFGTPNDEQRSMYETVLESHKRSSDALAPGKSGKEIDAVARDVITSAGRGDQFIHGLGHGVGLQVHEAPRLSYVSESTLAAGNLVTIEPGVYIPDVGGIRIENMVVVREGDPEVLNAFSTELTVV